MNWYGGSIAEAVAETKQNNKLFLVYIEGNDDMSKNMTDTYNDASIGEKLSKGNVICLKLTANSVPFSQFCAIYPVLIIPSSYFIGVNGTPIEIVSGSLSHTEFAVKIDKALEMHAKDVKLKKEAALQSTVSPKDNVASTSSNSSIETANQPCSSQSSENCDDKSPSELEERVERAKALLEVKKQLQAEEEKEKEKKEELERRTVGKALQKAQQQKQDDELKEWAKNRAKEKEEDRLAREKVKAMIAQDRAERAARYQQSKEAVQLEQDKQAKVLEEQEQASKAAALNSNEARIQFRLPDGSSTNHIFPADASLEDARKFVKNEVRPPFSYFSLCTTFPRRHFTPSNYSESLRDLQLAPSAVLLILPDQTVSSIGSSGNFFSSIFWMLLSPFTAVWRLITSIFPTPPERREDSNTTNSDKASTSQATTGPNPTGARRKDASFVKREGNIYRINNQSDDDENNTWNGNSTQQM